jgi:hypothetical protein
MIAPGATEPPAAPAQDATLAAIRDLRARAVRLVPPRRRSEHARRRHLRQRGRRRDDCRANPAFPNGSIRTSEAHRFPIDVDEGSDILRFISDHDLMTGISDGYRAADLRMLWFTAPYLHNGSVPTLEDLLRPAVDRPTTFDRGGFTVDTAVVGNDNRGHEFGTAITDAERTALAAYLRSL